MTRSHRGLIKKFCSTKCLFSVNWLGLRCCHSSDFRHTWSLLLLLLIIKTSLVISFMIMSNIEYVVINLPNCAVSTYFEKLLISFGKRVFPIFKMFSKYSTLWGHWAVQINLVSLFGHFFSSNACLFNHSQTYLVFQHPVRIIPVRKCTVGNEFFMKVRKTPEKNKRTLKMATDTNTANVHIFFNRSNYIKIQSLFKFSRNARNSDFFNLKLINVFPLNLYVFLWLCLSLLQKQNCFRILNAKHSRPQKIHSFAAVYNVQ